MTTAYEMPNPGGRWQPVDLSNDEPRPYGDADVEALRTIDGLVEDLKEQTIPGRREQTEAIAAELLEPHPAARQAPVDRLAQITGADPELVRAHLAIENEGGPDATVTYDGAWEQMVAEEERAEQQKVAAIRERGRRGWPRGS